MIKKDSIKKETVKKDFKTILYKDLMPKIYGIGAAIVILGAMFKILNWPGSNLMIGMGLTTEAVIFFLSAFEPDPVEYDWSKVYPELSDGKESPSGKKTGRSTPQTVSVSTGEYEAQMENLSQTLKQLNEIYTVEAGQANQRLGFNQQLHNTSAKTIDEMYKASAEAEKFKLELEKLKSKISALNDIYANTLSALKK